ncbi:ATP-binding cassette sub-family C member 4 [Calliopsis andreniformis]|uniref:ATP-binding cassette sub-family C member 4 n=1 Tax=Calliopsis andreniformis TaxID=337506 RepID=UPI003FCCC03A
METKEGYTKQCPQETANPISRLCFAWLAELFWKGAHKDLELTDLYHPLKSDESERLGNRLELAWNQELIKAEGQKQPKDGKINEKLETPRLSIAIIKTFRVEFFVIGLLFFLQYGVLVIFQPILQSWIISYFKVDQDAKTISKEDALIFAGCLVFCILLSIFVLHHSERLSQQLGMKMRVACSSLVYRKILRLSKSALTQTTSGQVVNLLSNDVSRFDELCYVLHFIWITPLQIIIVGTIIWQKVQISTIVGIGVLILMTMPVHGIAVQLCHKLRQVIALLTDKRVQLMNELIAGIQVIKMYAWEKPFMKIVASIRTSEIKKLRLTSYVRGIYLSFAVFTNRLVLFFTLLSFVLRGYQLRPEITYMMATYFEILQLSATLFFPQALILVGETMVSIKRFEQFLLLEEHVNAAPSQLQAGQNGFLKFKKEKKPKEKIQIIKLINEYQNATVNDVGGNVPVSIILERVTASWLPKQLPPTLCHVSMTIPSGNLCALVGPVGSGKSSILHLLLQELPIGAGRVRLQSIAEDGSPVNKQGYIIDNSNLRISYASQEPWLFSGTVRDNILFGQPYDKERYVAVTKACALTKDFQQLPYGDMSNVGEGGSSLSGGQKARVNLARAVYKPADMYLLDDPLSAVDARVARHLFFKCIQNYLNGKTRILVTHQLQFVKQADTIAVLDRGCLQMQGTYEQLIKSNADFAEMINRIQDTAEAKKQSKVADSSLNKAPLPLLENRSFTKSILGRASITSTASSVVSYNYEDNEHAPEAEKEAVATGTISNKVYKDYFHSGSSYFKLALLVLMFTISQAATSGNDYWLSYWTNLEIVRRTVKNSSLIVSPRYKYMFNDTFLSSIFSLDKYGLLTTNDAIYVYAFCVIACTVTVCGRNFFFMKVCSDASRNLHNLMFSNILRTKMSFFHHNPSGRILNRFTKDVGAMDEILPKVMLEALQIFLVIFGVLVMIVMVNYWMAIPLAILITLFYFMRLLFLRTAQNVKRLEGTTKSPVFSHINATLNGLTTIRTSGPNTMVTLRKQFDYLQDIHSGAWYMTIVTPIAFGLSLDVIACIFVGCICFSFILLDKGDTLGGNVGLAISQSLIIIGTLQHGMKQSSEVVTQITAVERILQYTKLPREGSWESENPPPPNWPTQGRVSLKNVTMKYEKDEDPVLKNLNVTIEPGWKVGIVGRTGAGKTSLISVLFRLFTDHLDGEVEIDDIDTNKLGLHELRSRLSIIPQQPFLFSESLRYNLDPFNSYEDVQLWDSLRQVELDDLLLDQKVMYSGSNLSIGQRQLICLARAILRNNRILVLDEATANIDSHTDALIQKTIRTRFAECTVITIAHRLNTIIDSNRVIVLDAGRIVEFGCPHELLRDKPTGIFSQMVDNTGVTMAQILRQQAENACIRNTTQRNLELSSQSSIETDITDAVIQSSL